MHKSTLGKPDIAYAVSVLGRFQSNSWMDYWKDGKEVMRYLQRNKDFMFAYSSIDDLKIVGYVK